ncbi:MAG: outer membrane beta-barrel protein [Halioglobus sp.]|nr:outer membrane beta-barrel protein [Halioglobus sp.]
MKKELLIAALVAAGFSAPTIAQDSNRGPASGEREFSLAGTGAGDKDFDNSSVGLSADYGWYHDDRTVYGIRQSASYADVQGRNSSGDTWNGSTRGYVDYHFGTGNARPFVGASLGAVYGDSVQDSGFAGAEFGLKYYVLDKTYIMGRAEYQFFFNGGSEAEDNWDDGAFVYTVGVGFNF